VGRSQNTVMIAPGKANLPGITLEKFSLISFPLEESSTPKLRKR